MSNKRKFLFLLAFLALIATNAQQKKYSFSLEEAIKFALDSSYTAQNARREVAKAIQQKWETTAQGLPQINGEINYTNQLKQPVSLLPAAAFDNRQGTISTVEQFFDGPVRNNQPLIPATGFVPIVFGTKQQATATATLSQLIFSGSYLVGLEASKAFLEFTETQKEKQDLLIIEGITNAYGSVLLTQESIDILKDNLENLDRNIIEQQKIFENGLAEEEGIEQLQITQLQLKNQLNNTERIKTIAEQMLYLAIGIPIESEVVLTDNINAITIQNLDSDVVFKQFDITKNNDYQLSELLIEQRRLEHKLERSAYLPTLSAFINVGTQANSDSFTFFDSNQRWFNSSILGANLQIPIFSSFQRKAKTQKAYLALEQARVSHKENTQKIELGYEQAKSEYEFAIDNLNTLKQNLELAERIENKNQIKFTEGLSSSFDLRQAQTQLYSAQQEYLQAQLNLLEKKAKLESILNIYNL